MKFLLIAGAIATGNIVSAFILDVLGHGHSRYGPWQAATSRISWLWRRRY